MTTSPGSFDAAAPQVPRLRGSRRSWWWRMGVGVLALATVVLTTTTSWIGRTVADGDPDDLDAVRTSLEFQRAALDGGSAQAAQQQFPEGAYFSFVLYGLAWTDLGSTGRVDPDLARDRASEALRDVESAEGTTAFTERLVPRYGIFYAGWTLLLRAQVAALGPDLDATEVARVRTDAEAIAAAYSDALDADRSPFLAAYPGQSWPVDNVVAMAGLRRADAVTGDDHGGLIDRWLDAAMARVDPRTDLLPHRTDAATGEAIEGARGTSQSVIQRFWPLVDPASAPTSYERFRRHFVAASAGFVGVREYPLGVDGVGDVDSGPLVLGFSASATAVAIGAARANGDEDLAVTVLHEADVFGLPLTIGGSRRYALGQLPIGDAFVTWARATPPGPASHQPGLVATWPAYLVVPWLVVGGAWLVVVRARRPTGARTS